MQNNNTIIDKIKDKLINNGIKSPDFNIVENSIKKYSDNYVCIPYLIDMNNSQKYKKCKNIIKEIETEFKQQGVQVVFTPYIGFGI